MTSRSSWAAGARGRCASPPASVTAATCPPTSAGLAKVTAYLALVQQAGRSVDDVHATVLDLPLVGRDRDDTWRRVEALRGRTAAATFAARHHAGTAAEHAERLRGLAGRGVSTVFVSPLGLEGADDVLALAPLASALR